MAGTIYLNGDEGGSLTKFYIEVTYEYSEAPFAETLKTDLLGPSFATADLYNAEWLTIGNGISIGQAQYGSLNDPNESGNWSIGDPSGGGDWLGSDYYKGSIGEITTSSDGYDAWRDAGRPRPYNYDEKPASIWVIKYLDGDELEQVKSAADEVVYLNADDDSDDTGVIGGSGGTSDPVDTGGTGDTSTDVLGQITAFFESKTLSPSQFVDEYADDIPAGFVRPHTSFDDDGLYGIEAAPVSHDLDLRSMLQSPMEAATTYLISDALSQIGTGSLAGLFPTLNAAETFQTSLLDIFINPSLQLLDLLVDENGNFVDADTLNTWLKANEVHQDAVAKFLFQNTGTVGSIIEGIAFAGRDTGDALMGAAINTQENDGYFASSASAYFDALGVRYVGSQGADNAYGTDGRDYIFGGHGNDSVFGAEGNDWIGGGDGDDQLLGSGGNDMIAGGAGDDDIDGHDGRDKLWGGKGDDFMTGGAGNDKLKGQGGGDSLFGFGGKDKLFGNGGADALYGGDGKDVVKGGGGSDMVTGGAGSDKLFGNKGADTFVFYAGSDTDRIKDMRVGQNDTLRIYTEDLGVTTLSDLDALATESNGNVYFDFGGSDLLIIENVFWNDIRESVDLM